MAPFMILNRVQPANDNSFVSNSTRNHVMKKPS